MPTKADVGAPFTAAILPSTRLLFWVTLACVPMTVALMRLVPVRAWKPTAVFNWPVMFEKPAPLPRNVFAAPVVVFEPACVPMMVLKKPLTVGPARSPKKALLVTGSSRPAS